MMFSVAFWPVGARAESVTMTIGKDTYLFDYPYSGRTIEVYVGDKTDSDGNEGLMHDYFIFEDVLGAGVKGQIPVTFGRSIGIGNAFAVIYKEQRYIVQDPGWTVSFGDNQAKRILVLSHELGHHLCGHTEGAMQDSPWDKELEADRFAGMVIKRMDMKAQEPARPGYGQVQPDPLLPGVLKAAGELFSETGSRTHPPHAKRVEAIMKGYESGSSPCEGRSAPSDRAQPTTLGSSRGSLWNHNGSTMVLEAIGITRRFLYTKPRKGMRAAGVAPGAVLFEGRREGDRYIGTAYVFSRACGATPYDVAGQVSGDEREVVMYGNAPRVDAQCRIVGYRNDVLTFVYERAR